ncbi:hypothetical protein GQR58_012115 [Nymphon striatum]|nr:hypothetical protein GQR58_012115 [Nymphon striatum]
MNHTTVTAITTFSDVFDMPRHAVHTYHIPRHDIRNHPQRPLLRARRYRWLDPYLVTHSKRAVVATLNLHKVDVKRYTPTVAIWRNAKGRSPPSTDNDWRHSESHLQQPDANSHRRQDFPAPQGFPPASQDRSAGKPRTLPAHALLAPVSDFSESVEQDKESGQRLDGAANEPPKWHLPHSLQWPELQTHLHPPRQYIDDQATSWAPWSSDQLCSQSSKRIEQSLSDQTR